MKKYICSLFAIVLLSGLACDDVVVDGTKAVLDTPIPGVFEDCWVQWGLNNNETGCDSLAAVDNCGTGFGACCDWHDACIIKNCGTAWHWLFGPIDCGNYLDYNLHPAFCDSHFSMCNYCQSTVAACTSGAAGVAPGDAECCAKGTCGQEALCVYFVNGQYGSCSVAEGDACCLAAQATCQAGGGVGTTSMGNPTTSTGY